ncbi:glycosyltransferase family 2 protein [Solitalea lacus]|uniref:glycosyltransferase family 2 protein n=1 Tax=Solitalea lacus TaxID=2911172 RepID=UPI001EDA4A46|nr:glycosyltransferase family 2 protein [Solitalea lacus]UKJ07075.1 glycosyltransferase family 2 protein [Solitalea lacus]
MEKIAAVVVTYNRLTLLKECIYAIRSQTRSLDCILVVNNGSTDGTKEWLNAQNDLCVIHQENLGGAGGFHNGMKLAFEKGYDLIWCMDDDGIPADNSLEKLTFFASNSDYDAISPLIIAKDDNEKLAFSFPHPYIENVVIDNQTELKEIFKDKLDGITHLFNGILFKRKVIEKIGLPKKEMFIWGDEREYHFRILKNNLKNTTIFDAIQVHPKDRLMYKITEKGTWIYDSVLDWKSYCVFRNNGYIQKMLGHSPLRQIKHYISYYWTSNISLFLKLKSIIFFLRAFMAGYRDDFTKKLPY